MKKLKNIQLIFSFCLLLFSISNVKAQSYCTPIKSGSNSDFYISNVTLGSINNSSNNTANVFTFYNTSTDVVVNQQYSASITYAMSDYNFATLKVWIDYNNDGDFDDTGEEIYTVTEKSSTSSSGITKNITFTVPSTAVAAQTRMRVAINRSSNFTACDFKYQVGEGEDYLIKIKPVPTPPVAIAKNSIDVYLDVSGNSIITANDINNGSTDSYDDSQSIPLTLSIDKSSFSCSDIGSPVTVTLTVTDSDGLTDTDTTIVTVHQYNGAFTSPALADVTTFCSYTASTPIMNYQCGQQIIATTTDPISFSTAGVYTIHWVFDNGSTTATSTQKITILTPATPTGIAVTNITDSSALVSWSSTQTASYKVRYKKTSESTWIETTATTTSKAITGIDDGIQYEVQVAIAASCANFSVSTTFTTISVDYCSSNIHLSNSTDYYISNTHIGSINKTTTSSDPFYKHFTSPTANLTVGGTFSGSITYATPDYNTSGLVVWIDFNNDGDFDDSGEAIFSSSISSGTQTSITLNLTNILIPETATLGKTRMRIGLKHTGLPSSACNFDNQSGEVEDYDVYLVPPDNTAYESAMITQVYHKGSTDRWIEITNTNASLTIPANTVSIALFKNKSGDQTGVTPTATYTIVSSIAPGKSVLIKKSGATAISTQSGSTIITNNNVTDFDGANDILIISKKTNSDAWKNRFDVVSNIQNNSSIVRKDEVLAISKTYTASQWVVFPETTTNTNGPELANISTTVANTNIHLGYHKINPTSYTTSWSNGNPDRSRSVVIAGNLAQSTKLDARNLTINANKSLTITDNLLLVDNGITINTGGAIKLAGKAQLIQTHAGTKSINGIGKFYIDQNSDVSSIYRFNYMSSPVSTTGLNSYNLLNVFKDGTTPTSASSTSTTPKDIHFISGLDGNHNSSPIELSEYWIYAYDNSGSGTYEYIHKSKTGNLSPGKGFLFKGPGIAQNYTFVGSPNDGTYTYTVAASKNILLGNPYPSAINIQQFLTDNTATGSTIYLWQQAAEKNDTGTAGHNQSGYIGGYATINQSTSVAAVSANKITYEIAAKDATLGGGALLVNNFADLMTTNDSIRFDFTNLSKPLDGELFIVYKSSIDKIIDIEVNGISKLTQVNLPNTNNQLDTLSLNLAIQNNDAVLIKSKDANKISISKVFGNLKFSFTAPPFNYFAVAQGFFFYADFGGEVNFKNSQRAYIPEGTSGSIFFKNSKQEKPTASTINQLPVLKLGMDFITSDNQSFHRQIAASFKSGNSAAYDRGFDSEIFEKGATDIYWKFPNDSKEYVIAGVGNLTLDLEIPLEITINKSQSVNIKIDELQNIDQDLFLKDATTNMFYKISEKPVLLNLEAGTYSNRFYITFSDKPLAVDDNIQLQGSPIYFDATSKQIVVKNSSHQAIKKVILYSIIGRQVATWNKFANQFEYRLNVKSLPTSVYIVKMITDEGSFSKKIIIN